MFTIEFHVEFRSLSRNSSHSRQEDVLCVLCLFSKIKRGRGRKKERKNINLRMQFNNNKLAIPLRDRLFQEPSPFLSLYFFLCFKQPSCPVSSKTVSGSLFKSYTLVRALPSPLPKKKYVCQRIENA